MHIKYWSSIFLNLVSFHYSVPKIRLKMISGLLNLHLII